MNEATSENSDSLLSWFLSALICANQRRIFFERKKEAGAFPAIARMAIRPRMDAEFSWMHQISQPRAEKNCRASCSRFTSGNLDPPEHSGPAYLILWQTFFKSGCGAAAPRPGRY
jgi:hypothetical protein